ncbi:Zn(2)-C6 fungal-type domain-containing protein [Fusarium sp. Ph1]|nr:Zn(2)-C6 fungal-type domain-containing protein [Fusarium sp. Ph1]
MSLSHGQQGAPEPSSKRRRIRKACIPCRQRKRKCDGSSPCGMCTTYGYACEYAHDDSPLAPFVSQPPRNSSTSPNLNPPSNKSPEAVNSTTSRQETSPPAFEGGMLDERQPRYVNASSAIAFPHILGLHLESEKPPTLHSFGYNFGIRPEEKSIPHGDLAELISEAELVTFSNTFFTVFGIIFDLLDQSTFLHQCRLYYQGQLRDGVFAAVAAGVAAIGSFLSFNNGHDREVDIVHFAKTVLEDPAATRRASVQLVVGWSLRAAYLRFTTRPNNSWIASCTAMHLAEAVGLHEEENISKIASMAGTSVSGFNPDRLRRIFWCSWSFHIITCYEYGRSAVSFPRVSCSSITPIPGSFAYQHVRMAEILPSPNSTFCLADKPQDLGKEMLERMKALHEAPLGHPFLVLTRADLTFYLYRRMRQLKSPVTDEVIQLIIAAGNNAVETACQQVQKGHLFFNALGSVFQYACVLLALDNPFASSNLDGAFEGLENIVSIVDTRLTREALNTARHLLKASIQKKKQQTSTLEAVEARFTDTETPPGLLDMTLDWDQILNEPYMSFFGPSEL